MLGKNASRIILALLTMIILFIIVVEFVTSCPISYVGIFNCTAPLYAPLFLLPFGLITAIMLGFSFFSLEELRSGVGKLRNYFALILIIALSVIILFGIEETAREMAIIRRAGNCDKSARLQARYGSGDYFIALKECYVKERVPFKGVGNEISIDSHTYATFTVVMFFLPTDWFYAPPPPQ